MQISIGNLNSENQIMVYGDKSKQDGVFKTLCENKIFEGKANTVHRLANLQDDKMCYNIFCGIGDLTKTETVRNSIATVLKSVADTKVLEWDICLDSACETNEELKILIEQFAFAATLSLYKFKNYKSGLLVEKEFSFVLNIEDTAENKLALEKGKNLGDGVCIARDLGNRHAADIYPESLAEFAKAQGETCGFKTTVYDKSWLKKEGFGGILSVGSGGKNPPVLIIMEYNGAGDAPYTAFVGKGITFDAGGYNLKESKTIVNMKVDMCGAANVLGLMTAIAKNKLNKNVMCVIPAAENLIGSNAFLPGTVQTMYSGKTVEITNTDAEGRLLLVDAINYVAKMDKVEKIVDIATLTGAAAMAFGNVCCAVMSNDEKIYSEIQNASDISGEKIWRLPLFPEYKERIISTIADYRNNGATPAAGAIIAGMFIKEFTEEKPWVHIDIAGIANAPMPKPCCPAGASGFGVHLMYSML